jgi:type IV secretory pathway TraG/TraD family ATPase VirD4
VFLGQHRQQYLRHEGPEHVLTFAPTRSGKGVGLVVPTLLSWPASAVIHDIKGENWRSPQAGARALALPAVQPDRCEVGGLQPAAGSAARRA